MLHKTSSYFLNTPIPYEQNSQHLLAASSSSQTIIKIGKKALEAEDLSPKTIRPILRRRLSCWSEHQLAKVDAKKNILLKKNGGLWQCMDYTLDKFDGKIFKFRIRSCYNRVKHPNDPEIVNAYNKKAKQLFPAVEIESRALDFIRTDGSQEGCVLAKKLGYRLVEEEGETYLYLPDRKALVARWQLLRESDPRLPLLDIRSSKGVADDITFATTYAFGIDLLLSNACEFVHDHTAHALRLFCRLDEDYKLPEGHIWQYTASKKRFIKTILKIYKSLYQVKELITPKKEGEELKELQHALECWKKRLQAPPVLIDPLLAGLEQLETALGIFVDSGAAIAQDSALKRFSSPGSLGKFALKPHDIYWKPYMERRYANRLLQEKDLDALWKIIAQSFQIPQQHPHFSFELKQKFYRRLERIAP